MTVDVTAVLGLLGLGVFAGGLGAMVGIGGGIVVVPALVVLFGYDVRIAVASSLVAVIATSVAAGSRYVGGGLANMRLALTLELATTLGGIGGGLMATRISPRWLLGLFGAVTAATAVALVRSRGGHGSVEDDPAPDRLGREDRWPPGGAYHDLQRGGLVVYRATRLPLGEALSFLAGLVSGLLGVGGGFLKVPAMNLAMGVPVKVAAATSNFMIGVTATASVFIYLGRGYLHPGITAPLVLGVVGGAVLGTHGARRASSAVLRRILALVLVVVTIQMVQRAVGT